MKIIVTLNYPDHGIASELAECALKAVRQFAPTMQEVLAPENLGSSGDLSIEVECVGTLGN